ncbi:lysophospholipase [Melampsora americana]|nr:lysophospholipase [Melampsora americana]
MISMSLKFCVLWLAILFKFAASQVITATAASYAPTFTQCPTNTPLLRLAGSAAFSNQTLCDEEISYRQGRNALTAPLWQSFYTTGPGQQTGYASIFDQDSFEYPTLALAHSGGGLRAALYGAGVLQAMDSRTSDSPIAGVSQLAMYQAGLSGGSWLTLSSAMNGYPEMKQLVPGWLLSRDLFLPGGANPINNARYLDALFDDVELKKEAGFEVSITDLWARALSHHFMPGTTADNFYNSSSPTANGAGILFSALKDSPDFKAFKNPYPIIVSNQQPPPGSDAPTQGNIVPLSTTVFETTVHEFGSFDPYLSAHIPTQYMGTALDSGKPSKGTCTTGFDQGSFVIGTSSSLFNAISGTIVGSIVGKLSSSHLGLIKLLGSRLANKPDLSGVDTAHYPNPFKGVNGPAGFDQSTSDNLDLVDGGENGENIPINPLLARGVDIILAADGSADTDESSPIGAHWPNGTALIATFTRVTSVLPQGSASFPPIPTDPQEWMDNGYSTRPTFFGCNSPSHTGNGAYPLVVYLPNSPLPLSTTSSFTNTSTFKLRYTDKESSAFLASATSITTSPVFDGTVDSEWPTCLSCAMLDRARNRLTPRVPRSDTCKQCFQRYCYPDGVDEDYL